MPVSPTDVNDDPSPTLNPMHGDGRADRPVAADVTILLPTYNRCSLIGESIVSILNQTYSPAEIIVIDDGSTDRTKAVVTAFGDRVRYMRKENGGKATALNMGLAAASGTFILVMDDDDLLPPNAIEQHVVALTANPTANFSYGRFSRFRGDATNAPASTDVEPVPADDARRLAIKLMERCYLTNPTWMVRASAQLRAGTYSEDLMRGQDYDMLLRLARENEGVFVDDLVLWQREHVAARGPRTERITTHVTVDLWVKYNQLMFERLDEEWSDNDFRPYAADSPREEATLRLAILQRATLMLVHRVYERGARHLDRYLKMLGDAEPTDEELFAASYLLGNRHGIENLLTPNNPLQRVLVARRLPWSLRVAFAFELRWRLIRAMRLFWVQRFKNLALFGISTFGLGVLAQLPFQNWSERRRTRGLASPGATRRTEPASQ